MGKYGCGDCLEQFSEFKDLEAHMEIKHSFSDTNCNTKNENISVKKNTESAKGVNVKNGEIIYPVLKALFTS